MKPDDACAECWEMADEYVPGEIQGEDGPCLCFECAEEYKRVQFETENGWLAPKPPAPAPGRSADDAG